MIYYDDGLVQLHHGKVEDIVPELGFFDAIIADPPYAETHLKWDEWVKDWPTLAAGNSFSLWCFGSFRMFWDRSQEFKDANWKLGQDVVWKKHNGSNIRNDRFRRIHELAIHFYRGRWKDIYKNPQFTYDATRRTIVRRTHSKPAHWLKVKASKYRSENGGPRLMTSVMAVRSCHGHAIHPTQKPEGLVRPIIEYSVPKDGKLLSLFSGSGVDLVVCKQLGIRCVGIEADKSMCRKIVKRLGSIAY